MPTATRPRTGKARTEAPRCYVLDTSVLLSDPRAVHRFDEHEVVLPLVVVVELEAKRTHPELGYFAREALRLLDDLRVDYGRLDEPIPLNDQGGTLRVELNHSDLSRLPSGMQLGDNDTRILAVARNLAAEGRDVVVVSKDLPLRVKAATLGLQAEEYRAELVVSTGWTGVEEVEVGARVVDDLYDHERIDCDATRDLPCNTGVVLLSERGSALARVTADKRLKLVRGDREAFGLHGRSAEQRIALDLLLDPEIGIVSLGGRAGTARARWPCAPALRRSWSAGSTARSWCSGRCSPSVVRNSGTCRAASTRRCRPGGRPCSTPSARSPPRRWSTRCSTGACSRCCR